MPDDKTYGIVITPNIAYIHNTNGRELGHIIGVISETEELKKLREILEGRDETYTKESDRTSQGIVGLAVSASINK